jgi:FAD/FMN-containing dehydrogenase
VTFGHLGDNNIHICVHAGPDGHALEGLEDAIFRIVARYGGSISAEHGIGRVKRDYLHYSRSPEELRMMRLLKHTLDPGNLLNPDVLFADQARP